MSIEFERYYLDFFEMINSLCKKIASGKYEQKDVDRLFDLAKEKKYPGIITELAESIGMLLVKVEARELHLKQIIEELEEEKSKREK